MIDEIVSFWRKLDGSVHPDDVSIFDRFPDHGFNLDFPPPAYIGDILNAPIIILENNGGFDSSMTPGEFPDAAAKDEFREALSSPEPLRLNARTVSPYYRSRNYTRWLTSGTAALVNGVAYRSINGKSNRVVELTKALPSARFHQSWLRRSLFPLVESGDRFLIVHRWTRWNGAADVYKSHPGAVFSPAPVSKDLTGQEIAAAEAFLSSRK